MHEANARVRGLGTESAPGRMDRWRRSQRGRPIRGGGLRAQNIEPSSDEERSMSRSIGVAYFVSALFVAGGAAAQGMLLGLRGRQGDQEVPDGDLRRAEGAEGGAAVGKGEDGDRVPAQRFAGAKGLHRQDRRARFEQDVRMRSDPVSFAPGIARTSACCCTRRRVWLRGAQTA